MHRPRTLADFLPGRFPTEPPLPNFILHTTWIEMPEYREEYKRLRAQYGDWAVKRAASFCPEGELGILEERSRSLYGTVLARTI